MKRDGKCYSVIVPLYNEEEGIEECYRRLLGVLDKIGSKYEIIFVNDGSTDRTLELAKGMAESNACVKTISFSRNFGHQAAVTCGMDMSVGDAVILIDADLQDPPEIIPRMIAKAEEGYDVVYAIRKGRRGESIFKRATAALFYRVLRSLSDVDIPVDTGDFRLINRSVCNALRRLREHHRFIRGMTSWIGFRQIGIEYERQERFAGVTKYPLRKMIKFSFDAITSFSAKPLRMSSYLGFVIATLGFLYAGYIALSKLLNNTALQGWTTVICLICIVGGINLVAIGIVGEYIARLFDEAKNRPLYVISETKNVVKKIEES